ncbi:MAG TPA: helix-hairpin-helix domain-containing protein [Gemmatirosa sp.]|nr:helix-hairpin-helix domain-containing protein [Gemmatirosa sp.]
MTPSERKALVFLLAVAALGGGVRAVAGSAGRERPAAAERAALDAQLQAVDSARARRGRERTRVGKGRGRRPAGPRTATPDTARWPAAVAESPAPDAGSPARRTPRGQPAAIAPVALDGADSAALERLPGVGPALARRIVAERAARGPFGSVEALDERVRGVGPRLAERLRPYLRVP